MNLTSVDIKTLVTALPGYVDAHRKKLLPRVLREWGRTDLEEHLTRITRKQVRDEQKQMKKVAKWASELALALSDLGPDATFVVARFLVSVTVDAEEDAPTYEQTLEAVRSLANEPAELQRLAMAASDAAASWAPLPGGDVTAIRYFVLQDLAAIFQWATGLRAGRRVRTDVADDAGTPYGPFWGFARAAWLIIFGSTNGLNNAVKTWALGRGKYRERSPFIANLDLRHPEWRIFDR